MVSICFVCLGNICRSPIGESVFRHLVREAGLEGSIVIDSAGTGDWHVGQSPDRRACAAGKRRGIDVAGAARQFTRSDFARFDYVVAMDAANYAALAALSPDAASTKKIHLLRSFDPASPPGASVPDPYYGGPEGFDEVVELCLAACRPLLDLVRREHRL